MKKIILILALSVFLLNSCSNIYEYTQENWHINTVELADEYFPKYFDDIEGSFFKNDVEYIKEYSELDQEPNQKWYNIIYRISESISYTLQFSYEYETSCFSNISIWFKYIFESEEGINLSQNYINIIEDITNLCSNNFLGMGDKYNLMYDELKMKYQNRIYSYKKTDSFAIFVDESLSHELRPSREVDLFFRNNTYEIEICLHDYLTDVNIWDK